MSEHEGEKRAAEADKTYAWRPARVQVTKDKLFQEIPEVEGYTGNYNIWYHKFPGRKRMSSEVPPNPFKCEPERDSGRTKANTTSDPSFCLFFARGCCFKGAACPFLHRVPTAADDARIPFTRDAFGRARSATHRVDMGGPGVFTKDLRTLRVERLPDTARAEGLLRHHFAKYGTVVRVRHEPTLGAAFVEFALRTQADFAKEAMHGNNLGGKEILGVRWAVGNETGTPLHAAEGRRAVRAAVLAKVPRACADDAALLDQQPSAALVKAVIADVMKEENKTQREVILKYGCATPVPSASAPVPAPAPKRPPVFDLFGE